MTDSNTTLVVDYWGGTGRTPVSTSISFSSFPLSVVSQGNYAYVGLANGSIAIVNTILAPSSVNIVNATQSMGFGSTQIIISGNYVFGCSGKMGGSHAAVVNVSDSDLQPQNVFGSIDYCFIIGSYAYTYSTDNLSIHDLSSPLAPILVKTHPVVNLGTDLNDFLVYQVGTKRLALVLAGAKIWVFDVTDPNTPTTLGYFGGTGNMGMTDLVEGESCIYTTVPTLGIWILAKDKLGGQCLIPAAESMNLLQMLTMVFSAIIILIPVITAVFLWKRERRIAESKRVEFWITSSTVTRTGIILALTIIPVIYMLLFGIGLLLQWYVVLAVCAIWVLILLLLPRISLRRQRKRKQKMTAGTDQRTRLLGMIKAEKKLNVKTASEMTGMSEARVKTLIYDLVGEGKLEGDFQGDTFIITSDVNEFIKGLEDSFATWEEQAKTGEDKKV
jgi:hypothetical protein